MTCLLVWCKSLKILYLKMHIFSRVWIPILVGKLLYLACKGTWWYFESDFLIYSWVCQLVLNFKSFFSTLHFYFYYYNKYKILPYMNVTITIINTAIYKCRHASKSYAGLYLWNLWMSPCIKVLCWLIL